MIQLVEHWIVFQEWSTAAMLSHYNVGEISAEAYTDIFKIGQIERLHEKFYRILKKYTEHDNLYVVCARVDPIP